MTREEVIKGLERCIEKLDSVTNHTHGFNCTVCPYYEKCESTHYLVGLPLMRDVFALLKEQEPKVMSREEVVGCVVLGRDKTLWFEFRDSIKEINAKDIVYNDFICDEDCPRFNDPNFEWVDESKRDGVIIAEYNDTFRCWTSRPTDEQREAVKWE